ncbi:MAG: general secretion pathway protein GspB [Desulfuromonadaceae bacterium]
MSSILKALKKLEHEKTGRFPESLNINKDILRTAESTRGFSPFTLLLFSLLIFGGGATATFLFLHSSRLPQSATMAQQIISTEDDQPQDSKGLVTSDTLPAEIVVVPATSNSTGRRRLPQYKTTAPGNDVANKTPTVVEPVRSVESKAAVAIKSEHAAGTRTVPSLRVNGIAFQNNGAESVVIVNGMTVAKGATIEGATVDDVRNDRVIFRYNGELFEILLGQSNR